MYWKYVDQRSIKGRWGETGLGWGGGGGVTSSIKGRYLLSPVPAHFKIEDFLLNVPFKQM